MQKSMESRADKTKASATKRNTNQLCCFDKKISDWDTKKPHSCNWTFPDQTN